MKKVLVEEPKQPFVLLDNLRDGAIILAKYNGEWMGMLTMDVINRSNEWRLEQPLAVSHQGYATRKELAKKLIVEGYELFKLD